MKQIKTIIMAQLALLMVLLCISAPAWANIAANTQIINRADLSYFDGATTQHAKADVTVTVNLVPGAPTILAGGPQTTSYSGCGTTLTDSFTITAGSNGPDTYNLSAAVVPGAPGTFNSTGYSAVAPSTTVVLGATVTTTGSSGSTLIVPFDGTADTPIAKVNGIVIGSTVVIQTGGSGQTKTVTNIQENFPSAGLTSITVSSLLSPLPLAGVLVAEQKIVTTTVTSGCITTNGVNVTVTDTLTATSGGGTGPATTSGSVLNTYTSGNAELKKYVRNVTTSAAGTLPAFSYGGSDYYLGGVTAKPNEILEYLLIATNTTPSGTVSSAVITDVVPTDYVAFKTTPGPYLGAKDITYVDETGTSHYLSAAGGDDQGVYVVPNLTVNVGGWATLAFPPLPGGTIPGSSSVAVLYQVTLIP